jgi:uncharacterized protein with PQ loop repeat
MFIDLWKFDIGMWKSNNDMVGFLQTLLLVFLFIVTEQQHHPWSFKSQDMLCIIPYITHCKSSNYWSNFGIVVAYDIDVVLVNYIYHRWISWNDLEMIRCTIVKVKPYLTYCDKWWWNEIIRRLKHSTNYKK